MPLPRHPVAFAVAAALLSAPPAGAQSGLPIGGDGPSLHLELTKPFFDDPGLYQGTRISTTVWDLSAVAPLSGGTTLFARLGFVFGAIDGAGYSQAVSKPRLGGMRAPRRGMTVEAHVDLPFVLEMGEFNYATGMGSFSDYEQFERYYDDAWSFGTTMTVENETDPSTFLGARGGITVLVPTGADDAELMVLYSVFGHLPAGDRTRLRLEVSGITAATESGVSFSGRSFWFGNVVISRPTARLGPEFFLRLPIDEGLEGIINFAAGARVRVGG